MAQQTQVQATTKYQITVEKRPGGQDNQWLHFKHATQLKGVFPLPMTNTTLLIISNSMATKISRICRAPSEINGVGCWLYVCVSQWLLQGQHYAYMAY